MNKHSYPMDVWDINTFDDALASSLAAHTNLIRNYFETSHRQYLEREASDHTMPHPENPFARDFLAFSEMLSSELKDRVIRAWHYTRLTDAEVTNIRQAGVYPSSLETIRHRLDTQVAAGAFTSENAAALYSASPYMRGQLESRSGKFWMVSHPQEIDDGGVKLLLGNWGGESVYFWLRDPALQTLVAGIGRPRILEIAVSLQHTNAEYSAARAVISTFGRSLQCQTDFEAFDLYSTIALGPESILNLHSDDEESYFAMARGYPQRFQKK